jgi:hypothetical protein
MKPCGYQHHTPARTETTEPPAEEPNPGIIAWPLTAVSSLSGTVRGVVHEPLREAASFLRRWCGAFPAATKRFNVKPFQDFDSLGSGRRRLRRKGLELVLVSRQPH